jgi:hypothetical protein
MAFHGGTWVEVEVPWHPYMNEASVGTGTRPFVQPETFMLLTDGTVLFDCGLQWLRLRPDREGNYATGSWERVAVRPSVRQYYSSAILADGRLLCAFGEFTKADDDATDENHLHIYDPTTDTWDEISWTPVANSWIHDVPLTILPDGRVLIATGTPSTSFDRTERSMVYDPADDSFGDETTTVYTGLESGLALMQDGNVLRYQGSQTDTPGALGAEIYDPDTNTWTATATPPNVQQIFHAVNYPVVDMGRLMVRPNGDVIQFGNDNGKTALYSGGVWSLGPTMPVLTGQSTNACVMDQAACTLANGNILLVAGQWTSGNIWNGPCHYLEFDGTGYDEIDDPPAESAQVGALPSYSDAMAITLPNGDVVTTTGSARLVFFTPGSLTPPAGAAPVVDHVESNSGTTTTLQPDATFTVFGTRLNGVVIGPGNKDEQSCNTNFPIVRLTYGDGTVIYCRTTNCRLQSDDSAYMGIDPAAETKADFTIPENAPNGACTLDVVATGMASNGLSVNVTGAGETYRAPLTVSGGLGVQHNLGHFDGILTNWYRMPDDPEPNGLGEYVTHSITASGGTAPYSYALDSHQALPTGVTFHSDADGAWLEGVPQTGADDPTQSGTYTVNFRMLTVTATDSTGATGQGHFLYKVTDHDPVAFIYDDLGLTDTRDVLHQNPQISVSKEDTENLTDAVSKVHVAERHIGRRVSRLVD